MKKYIVVDIDGTIAQQKDLVKYPPSTEVEALRFCEACLGREPIEDTIALVEGLSQSGLEIVFCTARPSTVYCETYSWLKMWFTKEFTLIMKPIGSSLSDAEYKSTLLRSSDITTNNTLFVIDDDHSVVKRLKSDGFTVLQVHSLLNVGNLLY